MTTEKPAGLEGLAQKFEALENQPTTEEVQQVEVEQQKATIQLDKVAKVVERLAFGALRAVRGRIAKNMPEILEEWPDEMLREPAGAVMPVGMKYLARLMEKVSKYEEEGMLLFTMLPLALGYVQAMERSQARTVEASAEKVGAADGK